MKILHGDRRHTAGLGMPARGVAVVIVGYNEKHLMSACLSSWDAVDYEPVFIIYVDNTSTDGSLEYVRQSFPKVCAISSGGNLGYCGGNNAGIRRALEAGAEFVLILNPDTVVCNPRFVQSLVDYLEHHPDVGKVGPRVFLREVGKVQNTILEWPSIFGSAWSKMQPKERRDLGRNSGSIDKPVEVSVLNGCCVLVRAQALRDVGLYDEEYWCYLDEAEWDWRAEKAGWKRHFVPIDSIIHLQKESGYDFASRSNFLMKRNTAIWYLNAGKPLSLLVWVLGTTSVASVRFVAAVLTGRSPLRYAQFLGKLLVAYMAILCRLPGRMIRGRPASA